MELGRLIADVLSQSPIGVSVVEAAPDLSSIAVELRFRSGYTYCCAEPGCHLPRTNDRLVALARERGLCVPWSVVVRWRFVIEPGAKLTALEDMGLLTETPGYAFSVVTGEGGP